MPLQALLDRWRADPELARNFTSWRTVPSRPAKTEPLPEELPDPIRTALAKRGIDRLYEHQAAAWAETRAGHHVALATGTASGKTLAYNLPVVSDLVRHPDLRALYLFPTKALSQDQLTQLKVLTATTPELSAAIYDGDTPQRDRPAMRSKARIIFTNPDMLHTGILPHHASWSSLLANLRYVVIDEMHTYRGVFGSHVANVLRRLKRLAAFHGGNLQFLLTSATIGNPKELAEKLIEEPVALIENDGSSRGERHFLIYNPPVIDTVLGLRKSAAPEAAKLAGQALDEGLQGVLFAGTRRMVEILLTFIQENAATAAVGADARLQRGRIRGYRSGYLAPERREIEAGLRSGLVRLVVATNALELGIDIGGLESAILLGYPGTVASARQQAGRAGRGEEPAVAVLVASPSPLDQYLARHPEYFFERSPEAALINADHMLILLEHLRCALFEKPFNTAESFGRLPASQVAEYLDFLTSGRQAYQSNDQFFWMADDYPAAGISLRSASPRRIVLQSTSSEGFPMTVGTVDAESATWTVHPGAVYLHEAQQYYVQGLDLDKGVAELIPVALDYYTEPRQRTEIEVLGTLSSENVASAIKCYGELQVTSSVIGFRKVRWTNRENLGEESLDLPPSQLKTTGYWISLNAGVVEGLRKSGVWTNDPNDYGPDWPRIRQEVRARDGYRCQICGTPESGRPHDVHHKIPFRAFTARADANRLENLITVCPRCHDNVEQSVRIRSGLAGLGFILGQISPLFVMCDASDLGVHTEPTDFDGHGPAVVLYDEIPAGIGLSQRLFELHAELLSRAFETVHQCECADGCPSCVGPGGENGAGGKQATLAILAKLVESG